MEEEKKVKEQKVEKEESEGINGGGREKRRIVEKVERR